MGRGGGWWAAIDHMASPLLSPRTPTPYPSPWRECHSTDEIAGQGEGMNPPRGGGAPLPPPLEKLLPSPCEGPIAARLTWRRGGGGGGARPPPAPQNISPPPA